MQGNLAAVLQCLQDWCSVPPMRDTDGTSHGTENTEQNTNQDSDENVQRDGRGSVRERFSNWRASRSATAQENAELIRREERRREAARNTERNKAARAALLSRYGSGTEQSAVRDEDLAPVPRGMRWIAVWIDRTIGALPLLAPLILSGYFTTHVFHGEGQPINIPLGFALIAAGALEGGVWKLVALLSKTMLEGDSTIGLRVSLGIYLGVISGMIYWHADWAARHAGLADGAMDNWNWVPAAGAALFSLLGVRIWMHSARFRYRVALREAGRVDKQAPKFAFLAWILTPVETAKALRHAVRYRIESPIEAVEDRRLWNASGKPRVWPVLEDDLILEDAERPVLPVPPLRVPSRTGSPSVPRPVSPAGPRPALTSTPKQMSSEGDLQDMEDVLKYAGHLLVVIEAFPQWKDGGVPSVRNIRDAIHAYRQSQEDGSEFKSMSVADKVQKALIKLRSHPHLVDVINASTTETN